MSDRAATSAEARFVTASTTASRAEAGAKRGGPAKPRADGDRKPAAARKADAPAAAAPKTTVKKPKKIVKDDGGEKKE
jgi:hypothetical protein